MNGTNNTANKPTATKRSGDLRVEETKRRRTDRLQAVSEGPLCEPTDPVILGHLLNFFKQSSDNAEASLKETATQLRSAVSREIDLEMRLDVANAVHARLLANHTDAVNTIHDLWNRIDRYHVTLLRICLEHPEIGDRFCPEFNMTTPPMTPEEIDLTSDDSDDE